MSQAGSRRMPPSRPRFALRRVVVLAAVLLVVAIGVEATVALRRGGHSPTTTVSTVTTVSATTLPPKRQPPYPVGLISLNVTVNGQVLPTNVRYPATGPAGSIDVANATPDTADGPYPLVVFSQGFAIDPEQYAAILQAWAAAGYVVADPTYPHTDLNAPGGTLRSDLVNHPAELNGVITEIVAQGQTASSPLDGIIEGSDVAVAGHSDGGDVSLAVAANSLYRDPAANVKAALIFSGAEYAPFGGTYFPPGSPSVPMLLTQGTADMNFNPPSCSVQIYNAAPAPKFYLSLQGAGHHAPYIDPTQYRSIVIAVSTDFLNHTLKSEPSALGSMTAAGTVAGVASITSAASVPAVAGACPQAP